MQCTAQIGFQSVEQVLIGFVDLDDTYRFLGQKKRERKDLNLDDKG